MARYRRKPTADIDAFQFFAPVTDTEIEAFAAIGVYKVADTWYIKTLEGDMILDPGSWIATGVAGERYAIKANIFPKIYEPVV